MNSQSTIAELAPQIRQRKISPVEITQQCLRQVENLNPKLNAFITVLADSAMADARQAEIEIASGNWRGPVHGIPMALKDIIDTAGVRTTAASELFKNRIPNEDAEVTRRLRNAGAVLIGKNNLHEFAYGGSSLISYFGEIRNPITPEHIAGGSSAGSAAAVVSGMACAAIGTDTAGSIREPAALCGCVGLKPTYGRVSGRGVIPLSLSLDHVGPFTASVVDAAIVLQVIAGYDPADVTTTDVPVEDYPGALGKDVRRLRVGVPRSYFFDDLDHEISSAVERALQLIETLVGSVSEIAIDVPTDRTLQAAESYAYHAENVANHADLYQPETLRRIRAGEQTTVAEYIQKRRELEEARRNILAAFSDVDVLVTPTVPIPAPAISDLRRSPEALRPAELKLLRNTRPFNVWGLPAISITCGRTQSGLPIGLQIAASHWREDLALQLAYAYEQATA